MAYKPIKKKGQFLHRNVIGSQNIKLLIFFLDLKLGYFLSTKN